jgi:outer membrane protein OmpA-like peptidoglycan-associated protein
MRSGHRVHARAALGRFVGSAVMVLGKPPSFRSGAGLRTKRAVYQVALLAVVLGLGACNPVDTWRDWTGASQNDPDPETTPNTKNLAAGEASDYPNLATVPPPPNRALTTAEREKLTQSLIADRTNAKYSDDKLRAGFSEVTAPAPPPPPPPVPEATDAAQTKPAEGVTPAPATPGPAASPTSAPGEAPAAPAPDAAPASGTTTGKTAEAPGQGLRKSGEPPEPPPMESSLEVPQVRSTPNPEQVQSAPPPPYPTPAPTAANAAPAQPHLQSPPAPAPMPAAIASAAFQPPPPPPQLPPLASTGKSPKPPPPAAGTPIAEIKFAANSTSLSDDDRQTLEKVVPLYQQNPGKLRIVGYAGPGSGAAEQLNSFRAALDRAQAVAAALTQAGIPSDKIAVEAAPSGSDSVESRAEVLLEH